MNRLIDVEITSDPFLQEECSTDEKLVFYQALIHSGRTGIINYSLSEFAIKASITRERLIEILDKFREAGKLFYKSGVLAITNHHRYYFIANEKSAKPVLKDLRMLNQDVVNSDPGIKAAYNNMIKLVGRYTNCSDTVSNQNSKGIDTVSNQFSNGIKTGSKPHQTSSDTSRNIIQSNPIQSKLNKIPSPPSPPKGRPAPDPQVWIKDPGTGQLIRNPAVDGRKEGRENEQSSGKGRKEGKEGKNSSEEEEIVDWGAIKIKDSDVDKLYEEFGKDITWDAIDKAADWAEAKGIKVNKDPYKFVRGFALKEASNG